MSRTRLGVPRVDAALFAHESNGAVAIDGEAFDVGYSLTKAFVFVTGYNPDVG